MKIAVFQSYATAAPHLATELEIIEDHVRAGDDVHILACDGEMLSCQATLNHSLDQCVLCLATRTHALRLLPAAVTVRSFLTLTPDNVTEIAAFDWAVDDISALKALTVDGFDVGYAVLSSLISHLRDPDPDLREHRAVIRDLGKTALAVFRSTQNYIREHRPDRMYTFNGRFAAVRGVFRACQAAGVDCYLHDRGCNHRHYHMLPNALLHDFEVLKAEVLAAWANAPVDRREAIARAFFDERQRGIEQSWYSYTEQQTPGLLPAGWDLSKRNIAIFLSSEDELEAIGDAWPSGIYRNQTEGLENIIRSLENSNVPDVHLYVRFHPNMRTAAGTRLAKLLSVSSPLMTKILPDDPVSTYTLARAADAVLTFGSTVAIEAAYMGRPAILGGTALYRDLGSTYNPRTHEELIGLLKRPLEPRSITGALMYGYYYSTYGRPYERYEPTDVFSGTYRGQSLKPPYAARNALRRLQWHPRRMQWLQRVWDAYARRRLAGGRVSWPRLVQKWPRRRAASGAPEIVVVTPGAGFDGSSLLLLGFLQWLRANTDIRFRTIVATGGPLVTSFASLGPVLVLNSGKWDSRWRSAGWRRIARLLRISVDDRRLRRFLDGAHCKAVYSNTICNAAVLSSLEYLNVPVISHVRETGYWFTKVGMDHARVVDNLSDEFIADSHATQRHLRQALGIAEGRVTVVHEYVDPEAVRRSAGRDAAREELDIPKSAFIVGMCGSNEWRKGSDVFVRLAQEVCARSERDVRFVWVGGPVDSIHRFEHSYDLERLQLTGKVFFIGLKERATDYIDSFDVLALTSREEPFGVVMLEAAVLGKPTVCFADAGGAPEFIGSDAGCVVPYLDVEAMADRIVELLNAPEMAHALGQRAQCKAIQEFTLARQSARILNTIRKYAPPHSAVPR